MPRTIPIIPRAAALKTHAPALTAPPPLSLYIHFPWCVRKCPYCDFNSHNIKDAGIPEAAYIDTLIADLEASLPRVWGRRVHSIFIGGGTPSLMSPEGLDRLLTAVRSLLPLEPGCEITLEANPGTVEAGRFAAFHAAGVTRVSVGIQSFNEAHLKALGRIHDRGEAIRALEAAATYFTTWNADLMYALPGQTLAEAEADLAQVLEFAPPHLSCYHLTLEPNTLFHRDPPPLPDDDLSADMQEMIEARLAAAGYSHYETSAFARQGHKCLHNLNYWRFGDYLGIGAGAHGKLSDHLGVHRQMRHKHPNTYLEQGARGDFIQEQHTVEAHELPFEFMMNALRLTEGVPRTLFQERTGLPLEVIEEKLLAARQRGLLQITETALGPSEQGRRFLNDLLEHFLAN
ncbi:radical SAM family heme chaperone HemW [Uliginosibacterium sp. 31-16]|uniref:radical SAM family heme chaperone HemW n=1 Tax=Uliginosibacterium sp. 31-16 TaxID=3068315 RepID=UPI00273F94EA|nr:radical SAM family heme chaperone HemW [Uliginosibacterium sp. 31-16]MDP5238883.1 radical SAM family heme chaperone HemW [Uliginosibacterium sp. 31-16]